LDSAIDALLADRETLLADLSNFTDQYLPLLILLRQYAARAGSLVTIRRSAAVVAGVPHFTQDVWLTSEDLRGAQAQRLLKLIGDMILAPGQSMAQSTIVTDAALIRAEVDGT